MENKSSLKHVVRDIFIITGSIIVASILSKSGTIGTLVSISGQFVIISSFIAGAFFTSIFTLAPAAVGLIAISKTNSPLVVAGFGALGAMSIDYIIISFIRKDISEDLEKLSNTTIRKHFIEAFHFGFLRWVAFLAGLFFVASPLPDELGLFFIGVSRVKGWMLPLIFYIAHFIGILGIISIANAIK